MRGRLAVLAVLLLGGALFVPGSAAANDSIATAEGPLLNGQTAIGTIGTENDVDWWFFYAGSGTEADIALQGLAPERCFGPEVTLTDANGRELASTEYPTDLNETKHIHRTVGPGTFYLKVEPYYLDVLYCSGFGTEYGYRLWITSTPPPLSAPYVPPPVPALPPATTPGDIRSGPSGGSSGNSSACRQARSRASSLSSRLRRAHGFRQRRRIRAQLRQAKAQVRSVC